MQADGSMTRRYGGTGLGLSICSQLVSLMGGRIWVDSQVGRGSSFHFTVCLETEQGANAEEKPPSTPIKKVMRPLRVLLAEDNEINQQVAIEFLQMRGHDVRVAANGIQALAALAAERFDVVLMDVQMPQMDGFKAMAAIREKEKTTGLHTPIIGMTGYAMKGDRQRCLDAGMDAYVCKPIRSQELYEIIENATTLDRNRFPIWHPSCSTTSRRHANERAAGLFVAVCFLPALMYAQAVAYDYSNCMSSRLLLSFK